MCGLRIAYKGLQDSLFPQGCPRSLSSLPPYKTEFRRILDFIEGLEDYIERAGLDP